MLSLILDKLESVQKPNVFPGISNFQGVSDHLLQQGPYSGFNPPQICTYSSWTQVISNFRLILRARNIICTSSSRLRILSMWIQLLNSPDFYLYLYMYISEFVLYFIITYFKFYMLTLISSMKDQLYTWHTTVLIGNSYCFWILLSAFWSIASCKHLENSYVSKGKWLSAMSSMACADKWTV